MQVKSENQTVLAAEFKIIPPWAWTLAAVVFVAAQIFFNGVLPFQRGAPPAWFLSLMGLLAGIFSAAFLLFIGYINRDAKRRGMSAVLWTFVAILIPNALGIVLYFVLRQPLRSTCPQCRGAVQSGFSFCPKCSYKLGQSCPQCQRSIAVDDFYCPYCGVALHKQGPVAQSGDRA